MEKVLPLCVDLDGTLITSDTMHEAILAFIKHSPFKTWQLVRWFTQGGKANLKEQIGRHVQLRADLFPYNQPFLTYLTEQRALGRPLYLASGTSHYYAQAVADYLGIFDGVIASDATHSLAGTHKADALVNRFGAKGFVYAGNANVDVPVWKQAKAAIIVNASEGVVKKAQATVLIEKIFPAPPFSWQAVIKEMRLHQWVKNLLVFIPLILAHQFFEPTKLSQAVVAFIAFCFTASSIYFINDLFDIEADRQHPRKKNRPFAAGTLSIADGIVVWAALSIISTIITFALPLSFGILVGIYGVLNLIYSLFLKQIIIIDVITLASVYTLRLLAGSSATTVVTSRWLFLFSMFIFISLALMKRYIELANLHSKGKHVAIGRGYTIADRHWVFAAGLTSGYLSLVVLALYVNSQAVLTLYTRPLALWFIVPLLFIWIQRVWLLVQRDQVHDDPVVFAISDKLSYVIATCTAIALYLAL